MISSQRCNQCNRKLRDDDSVAIGYGPVCYKKVFGKTLQKTQTTKTKRIYITRKIKDLSKMENLDEVFTYV